MSASVNKLIDLLSENNISYTANELMSRHTSFKIGGPAEIFAMPCTIEDLCKVVSLSIDCNVPYFILGKGSNILVSDDGIKGVVVSCENLNRIEINGNTIICDCGASLTRCASEAKNASLAGLSFAYGIPGSIGGAVYMNAGAYGGQISDVLVSSTYFNPKTKQICTCVGEDHKFGYRESIYKENPDWIILSAEFKLTEGDQDKIKAEMDDFMDRRRSKQPLEYPSAGSTFKRYPGHFTGQLIEESGLKGKMIGGAQVSEKHAGFIINKSNATSKDVKELINFVKSTIKSNYGFEIECEVIFVG